MLNTIELGKSPPIMDNASKKKKKEDQRLQNDIETDHKKLKKASVYQKL